MSVFDFVIATLTRDISTKIESKILQLCAHSDEDLVILKDDELRLNVQGSLAALTFLESKIKALKLKSVSKIEGTDLAENPLCLTSKITSDQAKNLGLITSDDKMSKVDRDVKLPYLYCQNCSFRTKRPSHLEKHLKKHGNVDLIDLAACDHCDFKCLRFQDLRKHMKKNHEVQNVPSGSIHQCDLCDFEAKNVKILKDHKISAHVVPDDLELMSCKRCSYRTLKPSMMIRHLSKHTRKKSKPSKPTIKYKKHECPHCDYTTEKLSNFTRHKLSHSNERKYLCLTCGLGFKRSDTLKQHLAVHGVNYGIFCDICGKSFRSQTLLEDHKLIHSDLKQFMCHFCGMSFKTRATQTRHIKAVHEQPITQKCFHCGVKMSSIQGLAQHLREFHPNETSVLEKMEIETVGIDINDQVPEEDTEEPVIYTLDLTQDANETTLVENNLQYLIDESEGSLIISNHTAQI